MLILAHVGESLAPHDLWGAWQLDLWVGAGLAVVWLLYRRGRQKPGHRPLPRESLFGWGLWVVALAVMSPIDALGSVLSSGHMVQHLLLMMVAAPLIALARPFETLMIGLPRWLRKRFGQVRRKTRLTPASLRKASHPLVVWFAFTLALWFWHLPGPYDAALESESLHALEHSTLLLAGVPFWTMVFAAPVRFRGLAVLGVFASALQSTLLAVLLTFARSPWYSSYLESTPAWGMTPLEDQQLAGVIMWVPGGLIYLGIGLTLFASWVRLFESEQDRSVAVRQT